MNGFLPKPDFLDEDLTPVGQFECFFDKLVIEHIVSETNEYATAQGQHDFKTTCDEMYAFIAILLVSGYAPLSRRNLYWENADDVYNADIATSMTRNRFDQIMKYIHLADNLNLAPNDKVAKVRPLLDLLDQRRSSSSHIKYQSCDEELLEYPTVCLFYKRRVNKECIKFRLC